jgi:hypothetical protein
MDVYDDALFPGVSFAQAGYRQAFDSLIQPDTVDLDFLRYYPAPDLLPAHVAFF